MGSAGQLTAPPEALSVRPRQVTGDVEGKARGEFGYLLRPGDQGRGCGGDGSEGRGGGEDGGKEDFHFERMTEERGVAGGGWIEGLEWGEENGETGAPLYSSRTRHQLLTTYTPGK